LSETKPVSPPIFQSPPVVLAMIAVLVAIHAALQWAGEGWQTWSLYAFSFVPARFGPEPFPMISGSQYWSFLTYAALHANWLHLAFNCIWLLIFGTVTARYLGSAKFLLLSAISAIAGAAVTLAFHWGQQYLMVGASGAVSGMMAAAVPIMYGRSNGPGYWPTGDRDGGEPLSFAELIHNRNALIFAAVWLLITLFSGATGFTGNSFMAEGGIAWEDHLGGFAAGLVSFYLLRGKGVRG
jgi:membrane associated rhomboid family serine protease